MGECICSGCRNLKAVIGESGVAAGFDCGFGFPSDDCEACEGTECKVTCIHYEEDSEDYEETVTCTKCGREMKKSFKEDSEGDVICIGCFLGE